MWKVWLTMLAMGCWHAGTFLGTVDDSLQLRLFLEVMSHESLPSERRIKGFATERMAPVIEYLVLEILHYGPRANIDCKQKDVFLEEDFEVHDLYAVCPNGKRLNRKPNIFVRGSNEQWRYQAKGTDCCGCPLRPQCTQGKGPKMLCVNVYREDLALHAKRMKADPQETRDLMGRHRAMSEGMVNNLMNHQGIRYAYWKGLALARLQAGLAIVMSNVLKWHKLRHGRLVPMTLKPAA